ncbi:transcriptional regulator [Bacillus cereus]|uniref:helix-turn-helix domain-containing protein n=1 Tax=Bacillus cereus TaxID=1396 RepID=UPI000BF2DA96|nr:helix-turn-helix domain-containing protein [Bacillus cereus]PFV61136.1 transcriptional regulator [Bacillus cereus]
MKELHKYSQFESVDEMDKSIQMYLEEYDLGERDRTILWKVACYSVKFKGVSYLKLQTLADLTGYAKRTVSRAMKSLTDKGILTRIDQMRTVNKGQGASITVINPYGSQPVESTLENATEPCEKPSESPISSCESITYKTKSPKDNTYVELAQLDAIGVPTEFSTVALAYLDTVNVYKLWSRVQLAARKHAPDLVELTEIAVSSVQASVLASKVKHVRDFTGYFYGVISQKLTQAQRSLKCRLFNFLQ